MIARRFRRDAACAYGKISAGSRISTKNIDARGRRLNGRRRVARTIGDGDFSRAIAAAESDARQARLNGC